MIFLIEYERRAGRIHTFEVFDDTDMSKAADARLDIELSLNRQGIEREVVLLQAESEEAVRKTHGRYYLTLRELTSQPVW